MVAEGTHSFRVRQLDDAANPGPLSAAAQWVVDLTPPSPPRLTGAPPARTNLKTATIAFTADTDKVFTCSVDGAPAKACSTKVVMANLADGPHSLAVSHQDAAGNASSTRAEWLVDTVLPFLSQAIPGSWTRTKTTTIFQLRAGPDATGIASAEYRTVAATPSLLAKPVTPRVLAYASPLIVPTSGQDLPARIRDGAGNWSSGTGLCEGGRAG